MTVDVEGSTTDLEGLPKPVGLGYVPEAPCPMVNQGKRMYMMHHRQINSLVYVKNGSDPITFGTAHGSLAALDAATVSEGTVDYYVGSSSDPACFRLGTNADRLVTATFEGDVDPTDGYVESAAKLIERVAKVYGGLVSAGIDAASIATLHSANSSRCGLFINFETTVGEVLDRLAESVGAYWFFNKSDVLVAGRLELPGPDDTPDITLTKDDFVERGVPIEHLPLDGTNGGIPARLVSLEYAPIFGVQQPSELVGGAAAGTREYFRKQFRRLDATAAVATAHPRSREIGFQSLIIDRTNAETELTRRAALYTSRRQRYRAVVPTSRLTVDDLGEAEIGRKVLFTHGRKAYGHGRLFVILGIIPDHDRNETVLDLWGGVLATGYTDTFDTSSLISSGGVYYLPSN